MKKSIKKLAVFVMMAAIGTLIASAIATAGDDYPKTIQGKYSFTGEDTCIISPSGFNSDLTPKGVYFFSWESVQGVKTFNKDGTGSAQGRIVTVFFSSPSSASSSNFQNTFTYSIGPDHTYTQQLSSPMKGQVLTGSWTGATWTYDPLTLKGMFSKNSNSYTLAADEPQIETETFSNGAIWPQICTRSRIGIRLPDKE